MKYTTLIFKVPEGYEKQVTDVVMTKIDGILSQIFLTPTQSKKDEYNIELSKIKIENKNA